MLKERNSKEISISVEKILTKVNSRYKRKRPALKKYRMPETKDEKKFKNLSKTEQKENREMGDMLNKIRKDTEKDLTEERRLVLEAVKLDRKQNIISLCKKHKISVAHIMNIGGFNAEIADEYEEDEDNF